MVEARRLIARIGGRDGDHRAAVGAAQFRGGAPGQLRLIEIVASGTSGAGDDHAPLLAPTSAGAARARATTRSSASRNVTSSSRIVPGPRLTRIDSPDSSRNPIAS